MNSVKDLIPVLQTAIGPMILISGVGLLMLSMSNRLGRIIDRARSLSGNTNKDNEDKIKQEINILWKRAKTLRKSIALILSSAFCASLLIVLIFFTALFGLETAGIMTILFSVGMGCVVSSLILYIYDVNMSLHALKIELQINE